MVPYPETSESSVVTNFGQHPVRRKQRKFKRQIRQKRISGRRIRTPLQTNILLAIPDCRVTSFIPRNPHFTTSFS